MTDHLSRLNPEQRARVRIDRMLAEAGWLVQDYRDADFTAAPGVAIREFPTPTGPMDYLLVANGEVAGSLEAKKEGMTLRQVETQADRYADGFEELIKTRDLPRYHDRLPFHYISTGTETLFTSRRDPIRRPREVFYFHRPETVAAWAAEATPYRARLRQLPPLNTAGLRDVQATAIRNLEASLADDRPKALAAITMGGAARRVSRWPRPTGCCATARPGASSSWWTASPWAIRLAPSSSPTRAPTTGSASATSSASRSCAQTQSTARPTSSSAPSSACTGCSAGEESSTKSSTTSPLSTLRTRVSRSRSPTTRNGPLSSSTSRSSTSATAASMAAGGRSSTTSTAPWSGSPPRRRRRRWPTSTTTSSRSTRRRSRSTTGSTCRNSSTASVPRWASTARPSRPATGSRSATSRRAASTSGRSRTTSSTSPRSSTAPSSTRRRFGPWSRLSVTGSAPKSSPGATKSPRTIFFAKHDQHAEDILKVIWEEFGRGSEFAKKITYKAEGTVEENVNSFRNDPQLRIAMTVEQIGTGTDVKAVECLVFMRMVGSRVLLNQMRGRAVRTMNDDDFWSVTPGAAEKGQTKDYSVLVDAVGLTDEDVVIVETGPTTGDPTVPLQNLLRDIGMGLTGDDNLRSAALRLVRLNNKLTDEEREEFADTAGGTPIAKVIQNLRQASSPDFQLRTAQAETGKDEPDEEELEAARKILVEHAVAQLRRAEVRQKLEQLQQTVSETLIHIYGERGVGEDAHDRRRVSDAQRRPAAPEQGTHAEASAR